MNTQLENERVIGGIAFEAVRFHSPIPHWRAKAINAGVIFDAGVFNNTSRPKLWESIEYLHMRAGDRFAWHLGIEEGAKQ